MFLEMQNSHLVERGFILPFLDVSQLQKGNQVVVLPRVFIQDNSTLLPYPYYSSAIDLDNAKHFSSSANDWLNLPVIQPEKVELIAYSVCVNTRVIYDKQEVEEIAYQHHWNLDLVLQRFSELQDRLMISTLRSYYLPSPITVPYSNLLTQKSVGKFYNFSDLAIQTVIQVKDPTPILTDLAFLQHQGNQSWIGTITALGHRSLETTENKKTHIQAGTEFENIVHKALEFLGFRVEKGHKGGAGGLDLFCSEPYPLVGECKSGRKIPSDTTEQLIKLGGMKLGMDRFLQASKMIIGPGKPTADVVTAAHQWKVSIMNPETLEALAELQAQYPGCINLLDFKEKCLIPGDISQVTAQYLQEIRQTISIRSFLVQSVKKHAQNIGISEATVDVIHAVYSVAPDRPKPLEIQELRNILIELSSPLLGYLGHKTTDGTDRFYYLRDLPQPSQTP